MNKLRLYNSDCRNMVELPDESVQMCVTSPPYWGLRKYAGLPDTIWGNVDHCEHEWGEQLLVNATNHMDKRRWQHTRNGRDEEQPIEKRVAWLRTDVDQGNTCSLCGAWRGQFGLEPTVDMYVQHTVEILREVRRVLRKDGVVFLNLGDSYYGGKGQSNYAFQGRRESQSLESDQHNITGLGETRPQDMPQPNLKPKDLCLIPFRVALAAQGDGWWVRSVIIWSKTNPMPESVTDRPTESHEYILMLTKSARYYYDQEAVREPLLESSINRLMQPTFDQQTGGPKDYGHRTNANRSARKALCNLKEKLVKEEKWGDRYAGWNERDPNIGRNLRSVWNFPTQPYKEAHFATFPEALPERCIKAATPEVGSCARCGAPWVRIVGKGEPNPESWHGSKFDDGKNLEVHPNVGRRPEDNGPKGMERELERLPTAARMGHGAGWREREPEETKTLGWRPSCKCGTDEKRPAVVLDCFAGSGTTLWVARRMGREAVGYELSPDYCKLIEQRNMQGVL